MTAPQRLLYAIAEQRDAVCSTILAAEDADQMGQALTMLRLLAPVWQAAETPHAVECASLAHRRTAELIAAEIEYLAGCRKNDKTRAGTESNVARLKAILETLS